MKKKILFLLLAFPFTLTHAHAKQPNGEDTIQVYEFKVLDGFSEAMIEGAHVSIYEADSTTLLVDSMKYESKKLMMGYFYREVPKRKAYVYRIEREGYPTTWHYCKVKMPRGVTLFTPKPVYIYQNAPETDLSEATVTASRILMVTKGDTIEYNAAAFRMQNGSMLDGLIRALPGVKLDENGKITVNGEFVSSLLVNGRDFFSGDPRVALHNLPAYTVNKVQVYRKNEHAERDGRERSQEEKERDPLVMDVRLKREYAQGWISNYELAGGTNLKGGWDERWLARLFAMRYTNHSTLAFYANANNLNDDAAPGSKGEWKKADPADGEKKTYTAGISLDLEPKDSKFKFNTSLQALRQEKLTATVRNQETFYDGGSVYDHSTARDKNTTTDLKWQSRLNYNYLSNYFTAEFAANYAHNKNTASLRQQSQQQFASSIDTLYNRSQDSRYRYTGWGVSSLLSGNSYLGSKILNYYFKSNYNHEKANLFAADRIVYFPLENVVPEQRKSYLPAKDYQFQTGISLQHFALDKERGKNGWAKPFGFNYYVKYSYSQQFNSGHQDLQRNTNDWLSPLTQQAADWFIDKQNSYHTTRLERVQQLDLEMESSYKDIALRLVPTLYLYDRQLHDYRNQTNQSVNNHTFVCNLAGELLYSYKNNDFLLGGGWEYELPNLMDLLDVRNETDPLMHYIGNPQLHKTRKTYGTLQYRFRTQEKSRQLNFSATYNKWKNAVATAQRYNKQTGVTTYQPMNINGNWQATANCNYTQILDKKSRWDLQNNLRFGFAHSMGFANDGTEQAGRTLAFDNVALNDELTINYRINKIRIGAKAAAQWTSTESREPGFSDFSYTDYSYGLTFYSPILWGIDFSTDIMAYSRRGYNDPTMNTTDWVWNASLAKTLGKKQQWMVKANAFDLLQQIANIRKTVNVQGRTETWYNTIPSYLTLHVVYRLDVKPKKKNIQ